MNILMLTAGVLAGAAAGGTIAAVLLTRLFRERQQQWSTEIDRCRQQEAALRTELDSSREELKKLYAQAQGYYIRSEQIPELQSKITELEQELATTRQELLRLKAEAAQEKTRAESLTAQLADRQRKLEQRETEIRGLQEVLSARDTQLAELQARIEEERRALEDKLSLLERAREQLSDAFKALSSETLKQNTSVLLEQAKHLFQQFQEQAKGEFLHHHKAVGELMTPVRETLDKLKLELQESEKKRHEMQGTLSEQIRGLMETQQKLQQETGRLVLALRQPQQRGRWGELQLRRVVELAGMIQYCDFEEQVSTSGAHAQTLRPDMIVHLPGGRKVVVDAKVSLDAYLNAVEAAPAEQEKFLKQHAVQIRQHVDRLCDKDYMDAFQNALDFVVMFIPGEPFFSEALRRDPSLIEYAAERRIVFATPTTLIALLRAVAYGWQQQNLTANARKVQNLGAELLERMSVFLRHFSKVGDHLEQSVKTYNEAVGSLESRLLVTMRRFPELGVQSAKELPEPNHVATTPKPLRAPSLDDTE